MNTARSDAARLRGALVGALSATVAVAAHGLAGATLPGSQSVVFLVLCSAIVAALASSVGDGRPPLPVVCLYLAGGQVVGHYALVLTSGHHHGAHWSAGMILAHACAAGALAVLVARAERLFAALAAVLWRLVVVTIPVGGPCRRRPRTAWRTGHLGTRILLLCGHVTRGPPTLIAA